MAASGGRGRALQLTLLPQKGETWPMPNCTEASCEGNGVISVRPRHCPKVQKPTCANGYPAVKVAKPEGCCQDYQCQCEPAHWAGGRRVAGAGTVLEWRGRAGLPRTEAGSSGGAPWSPAGALSPGAGQGVCSHLSATSSSCWTAFCVAAGVWVLVPGWVLAPWALGPAPGGARGGARGAALEGGSCPQACAAAGATRTTSPSTAPTTPSWTTAPTCWCSRSCPCTGTSGCWWTTTSAAPRTGCPARSPSLSSTSRTVWC